MYRKPLPLALLGVSLMMSACGGGGGGNGGGGGPGDGPDFVSCTGNTCTLSGDIDEEYTLTADKTWVLDGLVRVGAGNVDITSAADITAIKAAGVTLHIEPGTHIRGMSDGVLLVTRGSTLDAEGTAVAPITFSSEADDDFDGLGEWGGVVIQGFAPQYALGSTGASPACYGANTWCNVQGEGGTAIGKFGGNDPADDSGTIKYVRIAEAGRVAGPNNEVNGLTLMGVGHGTEIEYVQVHNNLDDGIEWFGGTVNVKHIVLTGNDDDDIDFDQGYQGNIQYAIVEKNPTKLAPSGSNDPRGIEANSSAPTGGVAGEEEVAQTRAVIANVTIIGSPTTSFAANAGGEGMLLRGGVTASIYNSAVAGFSNGCVNIDDGLTIDTNANVGLTNVIGDCTTDGTTPGFYKDGVAGLANTGGRTGIVVDDSYALPSATGDLGAPVLITAVNNGSGFVFDNTDYIGAVEPGTPAISAWWAGWTLPGSLAAAPAPASFLSCAGTTCTINGDITSNFTFTAGKKWVLDGLVRIGTGNVDITSAADINTIKAAGVVLAIRPGADIRGMDDGVLLVTRGSRVYAEGTALAPITFSSDADENFDDLGEWGGVVIQGFAPQYALGSTVASPACYGTNTWCNVQGEGGTAIGKFGGNDPTDNSGVIKYVRIAEAGRVAGPNNEVNGLTLMGVGHGTTVDYVQVHNNLDDGIEWFGGTVNVKHVVLTGNDDDDIDFDQGYQGNIQYAIIRKNPVKAAPSGSNDPRGIEANSSAPTGGVAGEEEVAQTQAVIANVTIIGGPTTTTAANAGGEGMLLRGGVTASIYNSAVMGFSNGCVNIDQGLTINTTANVGLTNIIGDCTTDGTTPGFYKDLTPGLANVTSLTAFTTDAAFALPSGVATVTAPTITPVNNGSNFMFDGTTYMGAVAPDTVPASAWWAGWTIPDSVVGP